MDARPVKPVRAHEDEGGMVDGREVADVDEAGVKGHGVSLQG